MKINSDVLTTKRLLLRPFQEGDAEGMFSSYCHDEEVTRYLTWNPHPSIEATKEFLSFKLKEQAEPNHFDWLITLEGQVIGSIDVVKLYEGGGFEVGYCLMKDAWGKGYMKEAFHAVLDFLFYEADYSFAIMSADVRNLRSRRVIEREGFAFQREEEEDLPLKKSKATLAVYRLEKKDFHR
jgi:[ribosomal protein S5]-alanine N-acetyltransferase